MNKVFLNPKTSDRPLTPESGREVKPSLNISLSAYRNEIEDIISKGKVPAFGYPLINFENRDLYH